MTKDISGALYVYEGLSPMGVADNLQYEKATVLVYDSVHANRHATRNALFSLGFREIDTPPTIGMVREQLANREIDLIVADLSEDEEDVFKLVRDVRHGEAGDDPFVMMLLTLWNQTAQIVKGAINCGADDVIARPFSIGQLEARVKLHCGARKEFVVASNYIGPDRRSKTERVNPLDLVQVPNRLRERVDPKAPREYEQAKASALATVNQHKIKRHASQIGVLTRMIGEYAIGDGQNGDYSGQRTQLLDAAVDLEKRLQNSQFAHVGALLTALSNVAKDLPGAVAELGSAQWRKQIAVMRETSDAIQLALNPGTDQATLAQEIAKTLETAKIHASKSANRSAEVATMKMPA